MNPLHPFSGPESRDDGYPLIDDAEVRECRRILCDFPAYKIGADYTLTLDEYDSAAELGAARDLELWGCNPFEED